MLGILNETVRRYGGDEVSVLASGQIFTRERVDPETSRPRAVDVPESLGVVARMESGATAVYHLSSVAHAGGGESIELFCSKGTIRMASDGVWIASGGETELRPFTAPPEKQGGWRVEQDFVDSIRDGKTVTHTSFGDGVKYMAFTEAVHISMNDRRSVELPLG
jgi:predicted dehydrogenase